MPKLSDKIVGKGQKPELSPNPDGSGYIRQVKINALSDIAAPEENVLYVTRDQKYRYLKAAIVEPGTNRILVPAGFVLVENAPDLVLQKGEHGTPVKENQAPKQRPQVFAGPVAFQDDVYYKGKLLENQEGGGGSGGGSNIPYEIEPTIGSSGFVITQDELDYIRANWPAIIRLKIDMSAFGGSGIWNYKTT